MAQHPQLFGKSEDAPVPDDTQFDLPMDTPKALADFLESAQKRLIDTQMTIMEHEPRQLIPVSLQQLGSITPAEPEEAE